LNPRIFSLGGALVAPLLFALLAACAGQPQSLTAEQTIAQNGSAASSMAGQSALREKKPGTTAGRQAEGDEILLEDSAGTKYTYRVTDLLVVDPDNVEVMEPEDGNRSSPYRPARCRTTSSA